MTIRCKLCKHTIVSNKPPVEASADVMEQMSKHLGKSHRTHMEDIAASIATLYTIAGPHLLFQFIDVPENETEFRANYEDNRAIIFAILEGHPAREPAPKKVVLA